MGISGPLSALLSDKVNGLVVGQRAQLGRFITGRKRVFYRSFKRLNDTIGINEPQWATLENK